MGGDLPKRPCSEEALLLLLLPELAALPVLVDLLNTEPLALADWLAGRCS